MDSKNNVLSRTFLLYSGELVAKKNIFESTEIIGKHSINCLAEAIELFSLTFILFFEDFATEMTLFEPERVASILKRSHPAFINESVLLVLKDLALPHKNIDSSNEVFPEPFTP